MMRTFGGAACNRSRGTPPAPVNRIPAINSRAARMVRPMITSKNRDDGDNMRGIMRVAVRISILVVFGLAALVSAQSTRRPPNSIVGLAGDHGYGDLGRPSANERAVTIVTDA